MARYVTGYGFHTILQVDGRNLPLHAEGKGEPLELSDTEFAALERDLPGAAVLPKVKKPAGEKTKAGKTGTGRTRQRTGGD